MNAKLAMLTEAYDEAELLWEAGQTAANDDNVFEAKHPNVPREQFLVSVNGFLGELWDERGAP